MKKNLVFGVVASLVVGVAALLSSGVNKDSVERQEVQPLVISHKPAKASERVNNEPVELAPVIIKLERVKPVIKAAAKKKVCVYRPYVQQVFYAPAKHSRIEVKNNGGAYICN